MGKLSIFRILKELRWKHLFHKSYVKVCDGGKLSISSSADIRNSKIIVAPGAELLIGEHCDINNVYIWVGKGCLEIEDYALIGQGVGQKSVIEITDGKAHIENHVKLACQRVWVRFGGELSIGEYTNLNHGSEIRCDEKVTIGSFNRISYNVRIWDTNTHNILDKEERRSMNIKWFPSFGKEISRPVTKPVVIGDDCWIGENACIMKGSVIGDESIIGFGTVVMGKTVPAKTTAYNPKEIKLIYR